MKTWDQVSADPQFKGLPPEQQEAARVQYFNDVVAPRVPKEKLTDVRAQFDQDTVVPSETPWSEVPGQALRNAPSSAVGLAKNVYRAVRHPVETIKGMADVAVGEMLSADDPYRTKHPEAAARVDQAAKAFNDYYRQRYGSGEGFRRALATDPVGVMADLSTVLGAGGEVSGSKALAAASTATNPLSAVKAAGPIAKGAGAVAKRYVGLRTGVGSEAIGEAAKAGEMGDMAFLHNMRGQAELDQVLKDADDNLQAMMKAKNAEYQARMQTTEQNKTVDPFSIHRIRTVVDQQKAGNKFAGLKKNKQVGQALGEVDGLVRKQTKTRNPDALTPLGLDQLKQRVGELLDKYKSSPQARRAVQQVYDSVHQEIVRVAPEYADTMEQYRQASQQIRDIRQALSLPAGKQTGFSKDVALRKLQSVMRNNVQANYGERLALARALEQAGGRPILPALAGQALSSWEPRGINRLVASGELGAGLFHPSIWLDLPSQSPRLMGEAAYAAGRATPTVRGAYRSATSPEALLRALLTEQAGGAGQPDETGVVR